MTGNMITRDIASHLRELEAIQPDDLMTRLYMAAASAQLGQVGDARKRYRALLTHPKIDDDLRKLVQSQLAILDGKVDTYQPVEEQSSAAGATQPPDVASSEAGKALQRLPAKERMTAITQMVQNLSDRLEESPDDIEGWKKLIRSYVVLRKNDEAKAALVRARKAFSGQSERLDELTDFAQKIGVSQ